MSNVSWSHPAYETIVRLVNARTGLAFQPARRDGTEMGIQRAMKQSQATDLAKYAELLQHDMRAINELIAELTIGETYFFREPKHFAYIRREVIPELRRRCGSDHTICTWCAGCASGEEAYSLAILCDQEGIGDTSRILATDISQVALARAREASYREWSLRGEGAAMAREYLIQKNDRYFLDQRIVRRVKFENLNLALDLYPSYETGTKELDLVLCRNVLIYFDRDTVRAVSRRLFASLSRGGWLITASGDPPVNEYADFETVVTDIGVFYRRSLAADRTNLPSGAGGRAAAALDVLPTKEANIDPQSVREPVGIRSAPLHRQPSPAKPRDDQLTDAKAALDRGQYARVLELTEPRFSDPAACVLYLKALASTNAQNVLKTSAHFVERHSLSEHLQYLHAVLLMERNLDVEAVRAAQRVVFLDRSLAAAHFLLGSILQRTGALETAQRHFRNVRNLCLSRPRDEQVAFAESETASQLATAAEARLAILEAAIRNLT